MKALSIGRRNPLVQSNNFHGEKNGKNGLQLGNKILLLPVCRGIIEMPVLGLIPLTVRERERNCIWILVGTLALHDKAAATDSTRGWV